MVIHLFSQEGREEYDLERLWALKHDVTSLSDDVNVEEEIADDEKIAI